MFTKNKISFRVCGAIAALSASPLFAQNTGAAGSTLALEEVEVTSSKRGFAESLQDMAHSIQALTEDDLANAGITDLSTVAQLAPSVTIVDIEGTGTPQVSMRGVNSGVFLGDSIQDQALTSIYLDDMPISSAVALVPNIELFDVERVEVLRGPQGTLYGNGAMGGNLRFITNKPNPEEFSAKLEATANTVADGEEGYAVKGVFNLPMGDRTALRIMAVQQEDGGFVDNTARNVDDDNDLERTAFRATLFSSLTDNLDITGTVLYQDQANGDSPNWISFTGTGAPSEPFDDGNLTTDKLTRVTIDDELQIYSLTIDYDFGWANLTSVSSLLDRETDYNRNFQDTIAGAFGAPSPLFPVSGNNLYESTDFVQEIRIASGETDSSIDWVAGLYYADQEMDYDILIDGPGFSDTAAMLGIPLPPTVIFNFPGDTTVDRLFAGTTRTTQEQLAAFGELTYHFSDQFNVLVGLRWADWENTFVQDYAGFFNGGVTNVTGEASETKTTYKVAASYDVNDDVMVYASHSTGFRWGGVNDTPAAALCGPQALLATPTFDPDEVANYEIGAKSSWLDNRVRINVSLFRTDWDDVQTTNTINECGFSYKNNTSEQESTGLEWEMEAAITDSFLLSFSGAYIDTEILVDNPANGAMAGDEAPFVPEIAFTVAGDYSFNITDAIEGFGRLSYQYVDERPDRYVLIPGRSSFELESYDLVNLRLGVRMDGWTVSGFVNNLTDTQEIVANQTRNNIVNASIMRPRTTGITVAKEF